MQTSGTQQTGLTLLNKMTKNIASNYAVQLTGTSRYTAYFELDSIAVNLNTRKFCTPDKDLQYATHQKGRTLIPAQDSQKVEAKDLFCRELLWDKHGTKGSDCTGLHHKFTMNTHLHGNCIVPVSILEEGLLNILVISGDGELNIPQAIPLALYLDHTTYRGNTLYSQSIQDHISDKTEIYHDSYGGVNKDFIQSLSLFEETPNDIATLEVERDGYGNFLSLSNINEVKGHYYVFFDISNTRYNATIPLEINSRHIRTDKLLLVSGIDDIVDTNTFDYIMQVRRSLDRYMIVDLTKSKSDIKVQESGLSAAIITHSMYKGLSRKQLDDILTSLAQEFLAYLFIVPDKDASNLYDIVHCNRVIALTADNEYEFALGISHGIDLDKMPMSWRYTQNISLDKLYDELYQEADGR